MDADAPPHGPRLRGRALRDACNAVLRSTGAALTATDIARLLGAHGLAVEPPLTRTIPNALRPDVRAGRVRRVARGLYQSTSPSRAAEHSAQEVPTAPDSLAQESLEQAVPTAQDSLAQESLEQAEPTAQDSLAQESLEQAEQESTEQEPADQQPAEQKSCEQTEQTEQMEQMEQTEQATSLEESALVRLVERLL